MNNNTSILGIVFVALFPSIALAQGATPEEALDDTLGRPTWEAGLVAGGGRVSDYPGADQSHLRALVAPVLIYRGPVLRVDQSGIRGRLLNSPDWEIDLSASAAFNARSNDARQGMPGLDYLFGVGPQLVYKGLRSTLGGPTLHLKSRALMSTDFHHNHGRGVTFDPELRWRLRPMDGSPAVLTLFVQPTWASRALHRYFYQVEPSEATATRPAYDARAGYLGTETAATLSGRRSDRLSWFVSGRVMLLRGSANADSPLLRSKSNFAIAAGVVWTPWHSEARAGD